MLLIYLWCSLAIIVIFFSVRLAINIHSIPTEWKPNNQEKAIDMLVEDIDNAKNRILIYGGRGDTYENEKILKSFSDKKIPINIVLQNENIKDTKLAELARKKDNINLYISNKDNNRRHFRVVDYTYLYIEKQHDPNSQDRYFKRFERARFIPGKYAKDFSNILISARAA